VTRHVAALIFSLASVQVADRARCAHFSGKRKPSFRVSAAYSTPQVHAARCTANRGAPCSDGVGCKHRLEEHARKKVDPTYVTPGGPIECGCEAWAAAMQRYHQRGTLTLINCDPTQWATSPWEVAKAFLSPLGKFNAVDNQPEDSILAKVSADDFDPAALFNLPQYCLAFQGATVTLPDGTTHKFSVSIDKALWTAATDARNHTLGHTVGVGLKQAPYEEAMEALEALLGDPALHTPAEPYVDRVKWAQEQLNLIKEATPEEMDERRIKWITESRSATEHYAQERHHTVKSLTEQQADKFLECRDKLLVQEATRARKARVVSDPLRELVQAPSGSGKTLIAVKLAAAFIADGIAAPGHSPSVGDESDEAFLLLGHSDTLVKQVLLPELRTALQADCGELNILELSSRHSQHLSDKIEK
jgi:hypothetical protein